MSETQVAGDRFLRWLLVVVLLGTAIGGAIDLLLDAPESVWSAHVLFEVALVVASMTTFVLVWRAWRVTRESLAQTRETLDQHRAERDAWRASAEAALAGFGRAIEEKFRAWGLTPVEREIALLLLKGHSHKEIAFTTRRSERTVRQHAVEVYHKSGLRGRAELAAFFLEDVSLPNERGIAERSAVKA